MQLPFCWVADHTKLPRSLFKPLDGYVVLFPIGVLIGNGKSKQSGLSLWAAHSFVKLVDLRDYLFSDFLLIPTSTTLITILLSFESDPDGAFHSPC